MPLLKKLSEKPIPIIVCCTSHAIHYLVFYIHNINLFELVIAEAPDFQCNVFQITCSVSIYSRSLLQTLKLLLFPLISSHILLLQFIVSTKQCGFNILTPLCHCCKTCQESSLLHLAPIPFCLSTVLVS